MVVTPLTENMPGPSATKPGDMYITPLFVEFVQNLTYLQRLRDER